MAAETKPNKTKNLEFGPWAEMNSFELELCCSIAYRVWEFIPSYDRAQMRKSALPLELFLSFWNPKSAGTCQPRNAVNGMGCTGEAGQTSKAGQFLRLHHSTWKRLYIQFFELLKASAA